MKAKFELKENVELVYTKKRKVPFESLSMTNLTDSKKMSVLSKFEYWDWGSLAVYKKENI